jgi:DNA-binding transcriptional ArsR family regulator
VTAIPTPPLEGESLALACKALAHPVRIQILEHLIEADTCICGELVRMLPLSQSTVSQHLKHLKTAGLVRGEIEGPRTCYCVDHQVLSRFRAAIAALGKRRLPGSGGRRSADVAVEGNP